MRPNQQNIGYCGWFQIACVNCLFCGIILNRFMGFKFLGFKFLGFKLLWFKLMGFKLMGFKLMGFKFMGFIS